MIWQVKLVDNYPFFLSLLHALVQQCSNDRIQNVCKQVMILNRCQTDLHKPGLLAANVKKVVASLGAVACFGLAEIKRVT